MKKKTTGKRLTRRTTITPEEGDSFKDVLIERVKAIGSKQTKLENGKVRYGQTFKEWLEGEFIKEQQILEHDGVLYEYQNNHPTNDERLKFQHLPTYLEQAKGFKHDSMECLTARVIKLIERLLEYEATKEEENKLKDAYYLGEIIMKRNVYAMEMKRQKENASKPRSPIPPIVKKLAKLDCSAKELWVKLIDILYGMELDPVRSNDNGGYSSLTYLKVKGLDEYIDKPYKFTSFSSALSKYRK